MSWLIGGSEITSGIALFVGLVALMIWLRPPRGTLQEHRIVRFPGAWIVVGLPVTFAFAFSVTLVVMGIMALS